MQYIGWVVVWCFLGVYTTPSPIKPPSNFTQRLNQGFLSSSWNHSPAFCLLLVTTLCWNLLLVLVVLSERERERETTLFRSLYVLQPLTRTIWCLLSLHSFLYPYCSPFYFFFSLFALLPVWVMAILHYLVWKTPFEDRRSADVGWLLGL